MTSPVRPELPTASVGSSQAPTAAVDNSAPSAIRPESTYKSGNVVQTSGATSEAGESGVKNVYMGAFYLGKWYLREGATNDWRPYTSGPFSVAGQVNLSSGVSTVPIVDFDISYLPGLDVYVGYGVNDSDISSVGHFSKVYTVPGGAIASDAFSQPWIQQQRSGSGGAFLGRLNGDLASYGRGLMVSKDNGATWTEMYVNGGLNGISPLTNLLEGYSATAVGSRYFRQTYTRNPAYVANPSFTRSWNYQLEVSADRINWQLVPLAPSIAFSHISEVSPGRFVGVATQEGERDLEYVGMTFLSDGNGGLTWTNVGGIPGPTREFLVSMTTINDVNIAVGADGLIKVSRDAGVSWSQAKTPTTNNLVSAASGANVFVVVGVSGTILRSTDLGTTWISQTSGVNDNLSAVAYGDGRFLAVSSTGTALTSTDGVAWEKLGAGLKAFAPLSSLQIAYGAGAFVIGAHGTVCVGSSCSTGNSGIFYSQDGGTTWNKASPVAGNTMTFGNGLFMSQVAFGYDIQTPNIMVSGDGGQSWRYAGTINGGGESMAYGKGVFASAGSFKSPSGGIISGVSVSYDLGVTWRIVEIPGGVGNQLFFNGSRWVGLGGYNATSRTMAVSAPQ